MKLIWLTDIHLNFLDEELRCKFYQEIINLNGGIILISGDIAEADSISYLLKEMANEIKKPIYFVLGNHDYYRGQVNEVKSEMIALTDNEGLLNWLPACEPILLEDEVVLLGQDGWADGRYGDYANSTISLNDERMIADLFQAKIAGKYSLLEKMQELADRDAEKLKQNLSEAMVKHQPKKIIVLTHIPPFEEACLHKGKVSNKDWLPYFSSKATGDVLMKVAKENSETEFLVLCGHTHSEASFQPLKNLTVKVGKAEYYQPEVQTF